jgi:carboxyl-terminal processing protease
MPKRNLIYLIIVVAFAATAVVLIGVVESKRREQEAELQTVKSTLDHLRNVMLGRELLDETVPDIEKLSGLIEQRRNESNLTPEEWRKLWLEGAYKGIVEAVREMVGDPYMCYVPRDRKEAFERRVSGFGHGLGLQVQVKGGLANVVSVLGGSQAHRAGLIPGDRIIAINGKDVSDIESAEVRKILWGLAGDSLELTVIRGPGVLTEGEAERIRITPGDFAVQTVEGLWRDAKGEWVCQVDAEQGIYYLRVTEFVKTTREQFQEAMRKLTGVRALVLDLRDNPGGLPESAAEVANLFLSEGRIFTIVNLVDGKPHEKPYTANEGGKYPQDIRIVVLVDGQTSSAAEVVAGAMRLRGRAAVVGARTRGKTWVQNIMPVRNMGLIVMSQGRPYLGLPGASSSVGRGFKYIDPDRPVKIDDSVQPQLSHLRAMAGALPGKPRFAPLEDPGKSLADELRRLDAQLALAIALLKEPQELEKILKSDCRWAKPDHE